VKPHQRAIVALALLVASGDARAQDPPSAEPVRPRVEVGVGGSWFFSGGTAPYDTGMIDTRVGVKLSRSWSIEGSVHVMPQTQADIAGYYRVQAVWRLGRSTAQPFLAFGGAGEFSRNSWPEYRYTDAQTGQPRVIPAGRDFHLEAPWYPTASLGVEKILASHLAVRAELTAGFGVNDYGLAVAFLPAVSVSIPIGRYRIAAR
jgi:hypothetical protein